MKADSYHRKTRGPTVDQGRRRAHVSPLALEPTLSDGKGSCQVNLKLALPDSCEQHIEAKPGLQVDSCHIFELSVKDIIDIHGREERCGDIQ